MIDRLRDALSGGAGAKAAAASVVLFGATIGTAGVVWASPGQPAVAPATAVRVHDVHRAAAVHHARVVIHHARPASHKHKAHVHPTTKPTGEPDPTVTPTGDPVDTASPAPSHSCDHSRNDGDADDQGTKGDPSGSWGDGDGGHHDGSWGGGSGWGDGDGGHHDGSWGGGSGWGGGNHG